MPGSLFVRASHSGKSKALEGVYAYMYACLEINRRKKNIMALLEYDGLIDG